MTQYPQLSELAPHLIERVDRAIETNDIVALGSLDAEMRRFVATVLATPAAAAVLTELLQLYRMLLVRCEERRDALKQSIGAQQRAHAGAAAYRSSGVVSRNA
jgi:hypothetical protein